MIPVSTISWILVSGEESFTPESTRSYSTTTRDPSAHTDLIESDHNACTRLFTSSFLIDSHEQIPNLAQSTRRPWLRLGLSSQISLDCRRDHCLAYMHSTMLPLIVIIRVGNVLGSRGLCLCRLSSRSHASTLDPLAWRPGRLSVRHARTSHAFTGYPPSPSRIQSNLSACHSLRPRLAKAGWFFFGLRSTTKGQCGLDFRTRGDSRRTGRIRHIQW